MNLESVQFFTMAIAVIALTALFLVPATTMAMSRAPVDGSARNPDTGDGAACDLPPYVEFDENKSSAFMEGTPPLDKEVAENHRTATFAMG